MKRTLTLSFLLVAVAAFSQDCMTPQSQIDLTGNALRARILNAADFGWDLNEARYQPDFVTGANTPSTIFLGTLWFGGIDPAGNLKIAAGGYRNTSSTSSSFYSGPLDPATGTTMGATCANWDRFFRVTAAEINAFLNDLSDGTLSAAHTAVRSWPARGNPFFAGVTGFSLPNQFLAPFHDADGDGSYDPMKGDYPVVQLQGLAAFVPDEQIWTVVNDQGGGAGSVFPLQAEIHITHFTFSCPDKPLINNAMFTSHKIINRSSEQLDSFSVALYVDFDLGCYADDYLGSHPATNSFYTYNRSNTDLAPCGGVLSYGVNPPVQAVTFLNQSLDRFMPIYNASVGSPTPATTDPTNLVEYFRYLTGSWRDGLPLTGAGSGYNPVLPTPVATHAFPGNPNNANEWSMLSANQPGGDQRGLGAHQFGTFAPGQIVELHTAWTYHRGPGLTHLQNVTRMLDEVPHLPVLYVNNFADVCTSAVSTSNLTGGAKLTVWPNPATSAVHVRMAEAGSGVIRVLDQTGRLVTERQFSDTDTVRLETDVWPAGIYWVQLHDAYGVAVRKVVVQ